MKLLISHKNHIKGYGFVKDLDGKSYCEIPKWVLCFFDSIETEFVEDPTLGYYIPFNGQSELKIPRGILNVYGRYRSINRTN